MKCGNCGADNPIGTLRCEFCDHPLIQDVSPTVLLPSTKPTSNADSNPYENYNASQSNPPPTPPAAAPSPQYSVPSQPQSASPRETYAPGTVPNYLVWAIISTLCCCMPLGVVSIVYAAQVDGKLAAGDYAGAVSSSNNAKLFSMISIGLGLFGGLAYFGLMFLGMLGSAAGA